MTTKHGAQFRLPFRAWLYQRLQDHSAIGNVARAVFVDRCLLGEDARTVTKYQDHFQQVHDASPDDVRALAAAWEQYQREVHSHVR